MMGSVNYERSESEETALAGGCVSTKRSQTKNYEANKTRSNAVNSLPPYNKMIIEAIGEIMQRTRCSQYAITKTISEKYTKTLPSDFRKYLYKELKNLAEKGVLVRTYNSFKLARKSHANSASNSVKMAFPRRVRSPNVSKKSTSSIPIEISEDDESSMPIEIDDDAESSQVQEETEAAEPGGSGSKVFIFNGTVQINAPFK